MPMAMIDWKEAARHYRKLYTEAVERGCHDRDFWRGRTFTVEREGAEHRREMQAEITRLNTLVETLSRALARYQSEEDEVGGDDPADHPYRRRGSWSGDDWCAVEGCTSKESAHL
jgi:hypothetical protein